MARTFTALDTSGWRRLAPHVWERPQDPTVYGILEIQCDRALAYLEALSRESGVKVRISHLITKALAHAIRSNPAANGYVARRRVWLRPTVDIFVQVAIDGGQDLSGAKISDVDKKSLVDIAGELQERADRVRRHQDAGVEKTKGLVERMPHWLLGRLVRGIETLLYDYQIDLSRFGIARDQFGSAMVSNVGNFGNCSMTVAFAPIVPMSRVPIVVLIGEVQKKAVVEGDRVVARSVVTLGCTFDHRMIDGAQGMSMAAILQRAAEDPEREFGHVPGVAPAVHDDRPAGRRAVLH
jgi:pyruvate/2-oxoglutarate dehydrogenase complex dihydrolipoamide acyltransferase (E2) component